jgi:predicted ATPase/transcriptional regulator with XRE-family HTH domain
MSESISPSFGELLRTFRFRAGLSQEALSDASSISVRTISDLARRHRSNARLETARPLASPLKRSAADRRTHLETIYPAGRHVDARTADPSRATIDSSRWTASIPIPTSPLVGRSGQLDALTTALTPRTSGVVTLTGPGGVGKTRLAIEAALLLAPLYADGAAFVELATVTQPELVPDAIARALGVTPQAGADTRQLAALLDGRELLLILDNLEQVIESASFVARLAAACPYLTILVTSRVRLRISSERELTIPPLTLADPAAPLDQLRASDAIQLFAERARRIDPKFELSDHNGATVAEICRRVDGLPLAIELAASRLRVLPPAILLDRLDRRLPILTGGDRDRPPRHQSMRETIAWSDELLDAGTRRFLRWMSVFTGGLSLDSAEALGHTLGLDADESVEAVITLVEFGLATRSGRSHAQPRFHLFETIREFGLEQLADADEVTAARRFHATHMLELASRDVPRPDEPIPTAWIARLSTDHANLIQAFDFLCARETAEQSLQFAAVMGPYWHTRGPFSEWQPRLTRALDLASPDPTIRQVHALFWMTLILGTSPDFENAMQVANRCLEMAAHVGSTSDRAGAIQMVAWVHECHEHWDTARALREQALDLWISLGNTYMQAMCLVLNAGAAYALDDLDLAQREAELAETMLRAMENFDWLAAAEWLQGQIAVASGRLHLGATCYEQSLRTWMQSESRSRWYRPLVGLADIAAALGQFASAARLLGAADQMLIVSGRNLTSFDRRAYSRAETRCREILGTTELEERRLTGTRIPPEAWLLEATAIVEAARELTSSSSQ